MIYHSKNEKKEISINDCFRTHSRLVGLERVIEVIPTFSNYRERLSNYLVYSGEWLERKLEISLSP